MKMKLKLLMNNEMNNDRNIIIIQLKQQIQITNTLILNTFELKKIIK